MRRRLAMLVAPIGGSIALCASPLPQSWPTMHVPADAPARDDGSVDAILNYQHAHVERVQSRRDTGGSDGTLHGADWDSRRVIIRDSRREPPLTLDEHGFALLADPKEVHHDYYDEQV